MMLEKEVDQALKLFIVLARAYRTITEQVDKPIQAFGLNPTEFAVLELLYHKGDQPLQKIGDKILLASGSITYVVDKLEKKELLRRKACPNDRRVTYAHITSKGKKIIEEIFPDHELRIYEMMSVLTNEEQKILTEQLKKLGLSHHNGQESTD